LKVEVTEQDRIFHASIDGGIISIGRRKHAFAYTEPTVEYLEGNPMSPEEETEFKQEFIEAFKKWTLKKN
jgi:hypothetical protein